MQSNDETLKEIPYPEPASQVQADPVSVQYKLADNVFTTENDEIQVGVWDEENRVWSTEFIEDLSFDREKRWLMFSTRKFAPIAYLQSKITDYPFDSWSIRCIAPEVGLLTVDTRRRIKIQIEIHPLYVKLIEMPQPELKHLVNKEMHPGILLLELSKCGIHLLPEDEDAGRAGISLKDHEAEERAIMDIATTVKVFSFQSMKWGMQAPQDTVICRMRENPDNFREFYEEGEDDWESVMWWKNKCVFVDTKNSSNKFNGDIKKGQATQAMLPLAIKSLVESNISSAVTADGAERCSYVNDIDFIDNVQRTMRLLRLLSFT